MRDLTSDLVPTSIPPLIGGGAMGERIRTTDWSTTALGDYAAWPQSLRSALSLVLNTKGIAALYWGPQQRLLYNDAYGIALGDRHPEAFGRPMSEMLTDVAAVLGPQVAEVLRTGEGFAIENLPLTVRRHGRDEETIWTYSFSPIQGEQSGFAGVLLLATEMTGQVLTERARDRAQTELFAQNNKLVEQVSHQHQERERIWQLSSDMLGVADEQGVWLSINPAWTRTLGWEAGEIVGRTSEWMEHPDDVAKTRAEIGLLAAGQTTFEFENRFRTRDGGYRNLSWSAVPENGLLYCVTRDVTEVRQREKEDADALAAQERTWIYNPDLLSVIDMPSGTFERINPAWTTALGWRAAEIEGKPYIDFVHPADVSASASAFDTVRGGSPVLRFENRYRAKDGTWRRLSWVAFPEGDKLYSSARDITDEREQAKALHDANELIAVKTRAERQQRVLQREMAHRIKNTLSMVMAIVSQSMRHATTMEEASATIGDRVAALGKAQDLLRQTTYTSAVIREVIEGALMPHVQGEDRVVIDGPALQLAAQPALGLSLAIHELATNAAKYGALSNDVGRVAIRWTYADDDTFRFEWRETGGPLVARPARKGFGSRLTNQIVPSYFEGDGQTEFAPDGLVYVLDGTVPREEAHMVEPSL